MPGPFWTPDEEGYLRGVWGHAELGEIAKYLKVRSAQAIRHKAEAMGLPQLQEARAKAKYAQGPETAQGAIQELFDIAMKEWGRVEPIIKKPFPDRKTRWGLHEAGLQLSDIHLGLKVDPELTGGLGAYDVDIAVRRALKLRDSVVEITQMHQEVATLKRLNVFALGDEMEGAGNIYPGQPFHLDSSLYRQWVVCGEMLVSLLQGFLTVYDTIVVYKVKANHGRFTNKPDAGHPEDNFELLLWKYIQARFQHEPRIKIGIWSSWFAIANRLGWNFYLAHGENVLPWSPYAARGAFNVKLRLNSLFEQKIHYCLFAHHHTPLEIARELEGAILFNGSWVGPAEYALRSLHEANLPSQNFFLVTPRYGMRALDKIRLADLKDVRNVKVEAA